jgi:hypothetical protein
MLVLRNKRELANEIILKANGTTKDLVVLKNLLGVRVATGRWERHLPSWG